MKDFNSKIFNVNIVVKRLMQLVKMIGQFMTMLNVKYPVILYTYFILFRFLNFLFIRDTQVNLCTLRVNILW